LDHAPAVGQNVGNACRAARQWPRECKVTQAADAVRHTESLKDSTTYGANRLAEDFMGSICGRYIRGKGRENHVGWNRITWIKNNRRGRATNEHLGGVRTRTISELRSGTQVWNSDWKTIRKIRNGTKSVRDSTAILRKFWTDRAFRAPWLYGNV